MITESEKSEFVVCTDSCSALQALQHLYSDNPLVREISEIRQRIHLQGKELRFIYSPSHIGIRGNEDATPIRAYLANPLVVAGQENPTNLQLLSTGGRHRTTPVARLSSPYRTTG
ncbi:hypothetical protein MTP99_003572 [Tenebrio molitor]|jgi:hypothetical protein|nr:hypothetical protein MTP99_003572 [Tenebrio molitor]